MGAGETVLVVEDEEQVRTLTRTMLTRLGYRVLTADSGAEALKVIRDADKRIDLLLTDIVMPAMSGVELVRETLIHRPGLHVLFMSGYTESGAFQRGMLAANTAFVQPFTSAALQRKISRSARDHA